MDNRHEPLSAAPPRGGKRRGGLGRFVKQLLAISALVVIGILGYDAYSTFHFMKTITDKNQTSAPSTVDAWTDTSRVNILLLGVDNRNHDPHPRSDTMIIASIDPVSKSVALISVMRDTYVAIPGYGKDKINAAYADGGAPLAIQTVKSLLNIPIQYYMVTDFEGFKGVIDAVGGVDLTVEKDMDYADDGVYDIHLKQGYQHLDGQKALMYVRFRHDEQSDFSRTLRQRSLLSAAAAKLKSPAALLRLPAMEQAAEGYVKTNITADAALKLGYLMSKTDTSNLQNLQIPPNDGMQIVNGTDLGDILVPDIALSQSRVDALLNPHAAAPATGNSSNSANQQVNNTPAQTGGTSSGGAVSQPPAGGMTKTATVQAAAVNVRSGPSTSDEVLTTLTTGRQVTILGTAPGGWDYVQLANGTKGYMASQFLSVP